MSSYVIRGDARKIPLADESVDLVVTSPPYWALRSYRDNGGHYDGQVGSESHPQLWLEAMWGIMSEVWRVLKPSGSVWINLGDKRAGSGGHNNSGVSASKGSGSTLASPKYSHHPVAVESVQATRRNAPDRYEQAAFGRPKSKMLLPHRFAIGCEDGLADPEGIGWIVRQDQVIGKLNGLPESVTDRTRDSHEMFFHMVKQERYFSATDEIREPSSGYERPNGAARATPDETRSRTFLDTTNPLGKLPGSVWSVASEPFIVPPDIKARYDLPDHFACVDEATEILTRRGWLTHDQLRVGDMVAGYDMATGLGTWTPCMIVNRFHHAGEMIAVEKRDLSMRLTPNHRAVAAKAHPITKHPGEMDFVRGDELTSQHYIPRSADWKRERHNGIGKALAALCGWVAAEGCYAPHDLVVLSQSETVNPDAVVEIDRLLAEVPHFEPGLVSRCRGPREGLQSLLRTTGDGVWRGKPVTQVYWRLPLGLGQRIRQLMPEKKITASLVNLPTDEKEALLNAFIDGDGHRRPDGRIGIFQKDRVNLDWLQAIAVTLGYKTTLRERFQGWVLYLTEGGRPITLRGTNGSHAPIPRVQHDGVVWCPTTGMGTWFARRNGSVFVTGNCFVGGTELVRRIMLGWSPHAICLTCGKGRRPVVEKTKVASPRPNGFTSMTHSHGPDGREGERPSETATILGYSCACGVDPDEPSLSAVVLDPFVGSGTTLLVANALGRTGIGIDLSADYCRLAAWRASQRSEKVVSRTWAERQGSLL